MVLGDKLFDEIGNISGFKVTKVHPVEGVTTEVSFISHIKGEGKYPSGENLGSGTLTKYPHGIIDGVYQGSVTITKSGTILSGGHMRRAKLPMKVKSED